MASGSRIGVAGKLIGGVFGVLTLLVIELVTTMLLYSYLNLSHPDTFGWLVRQSRGVLDLLAGQIELWFKGWSNAAYASVFGELGPKSILLLLMGLVVAAVIRWAVWVIHGLLGKAD